MSIVTACSLYYNIFSTYLCLLGKIKVHKIGYRLSIQLTTITSDIFRGILKSGGAVNHYVSGVIASMLSLGLEDEHIDLLIHTYKVPIVVSGSLLSYRLMIIDN